MRNIINVPILPMWAAKSAASQFPHQVFPLSGREAYRQAISLRLLPALRAFNPNLILLSTGFDPAAGDVGNSRNGEPGMDVRVEDFEWATTEIMKIADICCNGRMVSVLEGGYGSRRLILPGAATGGHVSTRKSAKVRNRNPIRIS
jgi:acetoin utilization deacetylase AcuC-like enzyme